MGTEDSDWQAHAARTRGEITAAHGSADSLERILPNLADDETKRKIELVIQSYRLHANHLSEHIRDEPPMTTECRECARLAKEVESALVNIASVTQAQREAFRQNKYAEFMQLDKELENALGRKERVFGAFRQHKTEHQS